MRVYLDNAATTRPYNEVREIVDEYNDKYYANASSLHSFGREARKGIEWAREEIAGLINASPREIIFTSGATESDNWAIRGAAYHNKNKGRHIITSAIEHHAVLHTCSQLEKEGFDVTYLPVDSDGNINIRELKDAIREDTILISIMAANNEIGTIEPIKEIGEIAGKKGILFHTDAVQAVGKMDIDVDKMNIDLLSMSAHKIHGPKGVGFLYINKKVILDVFMQGGGQERALRAGTYNAPSIAGFGKAVEIMKKSMSDDVKYIEKLRDYFIDDILKNVPDTILNGSREHRLCNNINFTFKGIEGEAFLYALDLEGIACSTGSACTADSGSESHVIDALGDSNKFEVGASVRFSLSKFNTKEEIDYTIEVLKRTVERLRKLSPFY
ncbi:cysteine desulfurase [Anaerofustis stercorihominis]|uniref:cysteine desulfurase n=2 Tax=Anaerofustis stercorihominis TaxID=214853 RepID=B1CA55_9FIRM|nr:cysteine desulfurase family protein [Anaerofustis stercorihominis]EDS72373.1 putative cysteine desulfurase NifS [Anaerofustis stercorihominis DSM 17244]MCQ4795483.1 cysteine desulfurase [Anaerofustis stercorihominis]